VTPEVRTLGRLGVHDRPVGRLRGDLVETSPGDRHGPRCAVLPVENDRYLAFTLHNDANGAVELDALIGP